MKFSSSIVDLFKYTVEITLNSCDHLSRFTFSKNIIIKNVFLNLFNHFRNITWEFMILNVKTAKFYSTTVNVNIFSIKAGFTSVYNETS